MKTYRGFIAKCEGNSHKESGTPCQDDVKCFPDIDDKNMAICSAADGHGDKKYFRSEDGAKIATEIALNTMKDFVEIQLKLLQDQNGCLDSELSKNIISDNNYINILSQLVACIISDWNDSVQKHWIENPLTDTEKSKYAENYQKNENTESISHILKIYGTTLMIGVMTDFFSFIIQCGDGGACIVEQDGSVHSPPGLFDKSQDFGRTNSICSNNSFDLFRYHYAEKKPKAILLVSDGVRESYQGNEGKGLQLFCGGLIELYLTNHQEAQNELEEWLPTLTEKGNRDDVSVAGIYWTEEDGKLLVGTGNISTSSEIINDSPDVTQETIVAIDETSDSTQEKKGFDIDDTPKESLGIEFLSAETNTETNILPELENVSGQNVKTIDLSIDNVDVSGPLNDSKSEVRIRDIVEFGSIKWVILDILDDRILLLSQYILEKKEYLERYSWWDILRWRKALMNLSWNNCSLRRYFNEIFYHKFNRELQRFIVSIQNKNKNNICYGTEDNIDTTDEIFLLSIEDIMKYFPISIDGDHDVKYISNEYDSDRVAIPENEYGWWLRTLGRAKSQATYITNKGQVCISGVSVDKKIGVRPAIWVKRDYFKISSKTNENQEA